MGNILRKVLRAKFFSVPLALWITIWVGFIAPPIIVWLLGGLEGELLAPYLFLGAGLALTLTITFIYENKVLGLEWPFKL